MTTNPKWDTDRRGGHLVQDHAGDWHVQWYTVEKADGPTAGYVVVQKDGPMEDDDHIKNDLKSSKKKAKARVKQRKKKREVASAAAEVRRNELRSVSKGLDDMSKQPEPILVVAKALVVDGRPTQYLEKKHFMVKMQEMAERQFPTERPAIAFAKFIQTTDDGKLMFQAHKMAKGQDWQGDDEVRPMPTTSTGYDAMMEKAQKLMAENPGKYTLPGAFKTVYAAHPELVAMDKAAHVAKVTKVMGY
jgi:hypothetical protein